MTEIHQMSIVGRVSHFFVVHRPLSLIFLMVTLAFGLIAFFLTPKQYNPEIIRPAFSVALTYQGATLDEAENRVVNELVEKVNAVPGVDEVFTEVRDGATIRATVIFTVGYDPVRAKLDLVTQLEQHEYLAQGLVGKPSIMEVNPETIPVMQIAFTSDSVTGADLRDVVTRLATKISGVAEVSDVSVYGAYQSSLVIELDPVLLSVHALSPEAVVRVLEQSQSRLVHGGIQSGGYRIETVFDGRVMTAEAIGQLAVKEGILVRDVARIYTGTTGDRSYVFFHDRDGAGEVVMLSVAKVEGSSAPEVTAAVREMLEATRTTPPFDALSYKIVSDDGVTAATEIRGLTTNLVTSVAIVGLVLLLFLSARAALVVLIAIPTTLLIVFALGYLFDQTINRITLFALILSLGLLVDSAIVVVENIYAHLKEWQSETSPVSRERIIARAVDEIGVGLLLSTLTSVIVFLPMRYISGMMGPYMGPIAFFVPVALVVSLFVAITVTPYVASFLLRGEEKPNVVTAYTFRLMKNITAYYTRFLTAVLYSRMKQRQVLGRALLVFVIALALPAFALVHFQMLPKADRDQLYVYIDMPAGTSVAATKEHTQSVVATMLHDADVVHVQSFVGTAPIVDFNGMYKGAQGRNAANQATLRVNLTPATDRDRSSTEVVTDLRRELMKQETYPNTVRLVEEPPGPPVQATVVAKVSAADAGVARAATEDLATFFRGVSGVVDIDTSTTEAVSRVRYEFDRVAADALGVSADAVQQMIMLVGGGYTVGEFQGGGAVEYTPIVLTLPAELKDAPQDIAALSVVAESGATVSLVSVLRVHHEVEPSLRYFEDATAVSYVTAEVENRPVIYVVIEIMHAIITGSVAGYHVTEWNLFGMTLRDAGENAVTVNWGGEWEMTLENFRDLGIAMGVALFMVYAVLVAQYNRFATPAYILVTVPLALIGILFGFLILDTGFGSYLTATALIGFIALIGIVVNNAIIFLEYVEQATRNGLAFKEALIAAGEARLRPILLTSLTTILGSLTIAGDPVWSGLAWSIVFGLSLSTVLTLVVYPTLLVYFMKEETLISS